MDHWRNIRDYTVLVMVRKRYVSTLQRELQEAISEYEDHIQRTSECEVVLKTTAAERDAYASKSAKRVGFGRVVKLDEVQRARDHGMELEKLIEGAERNLAHVTQEVAKARDRCAEIRHQIAISEARLQAFETQITRGKKCLSLQKDEREEDELADVGRRLLDA